MLVDWGNGEGVGSVGACVGPNEGVDGGAGVGIASAVGIGMGVRVGNGVGVRKTLGLLPRSRV